jgi:uncharacterized protein YjbJ (UPF0337 family)
MNKDQVKDQVKDQAKDMVGKVQETTAMPLGSKSHDVKGVDPQAQSKNQKGHGAAKELVTDAHQAARAAAPTHSGTRPHSS